MGPVDYPAIPAGTDAIRLKISHLVEPKPKQPSDQTAPSAESSPEKTSPSGRLLSLDALRGLTIVLMLLVNNMALDKATPSQLVHAVWNGGVHLADLVFPWFLFCMGLAVPLSMRSMVSRGMPAGQRIARILIRAALLFVFGCMIVSAQLWKPTFSLDVLQLIALAYLFGTLLYSTGWRGRIIIAALLLAGYGLALALIPLPPQGRPSFEESHNLVKHVNETYLAQINLAGLLSVIPTTALVLIGASLTNIVRMKDRSSTWKLAALAGSGVLLTAASIVWNEALPFNKTVWTPSYILLSAGLGAIILAALYWVLDIKKWTWWAYPLLVYGSNALLAYIGPVLIKLVILQKIKITFHGTRMSIANAWIHLFTDSLGRIPGGWAYTMSYLLIIWLILAVLYKKKWFLRV